MPQQLTDLVQRRTLPQQLGRGGMPESVRGHLTQACTLARGHDDLRDTTGGQRPTWRFDPHEHLAP